MTSPIIKLDRQVLAQPQEVAFCRMCPQSNQRPRIVFDSEGVCSACRFAQHEDNEVDWGAREQELVKLLESHRSGEGAYDVIVASSGGKDSAYVAGTLKWDYNMTPLCATAAPFERTAIGQRNYDNFIRSGFATVEGHPNGRFHRKLARLCFEVLMDPWWPFSALQMSWPHWVALRWGIPLIMLGEAGEALYSGSSRVFDQPAMPLDWWPSEYWKGVTIDDLVVFGLEHGYLTPEDFQPADLEMYRPPPVEALKSRGIQFYWMSYFRHWTPQHNFYYAAEHTGFSPKPERSEGTFSRYSSLDDKLDGLHFWGMLVKFGIGRGTSDAAHEVRDHHITREEAVALVRRYDTEFPQAHFQWALDYLGIDEEHFWAVVDAWRPEHLWGRDGTQWILKHQVS